MRRLGLLVMTIGVLFAATAPALADDTSTVEVSAGWRYYHNALSGTAVLPLQPIDNYPKGWYADVSGNLSPKFAIVGDVGGTYNKATETPAATTFVTVTESSDIKFHTFMGGLRVRAPQNPRLVPFGQILFGGTHVASTSTLTTRVIQTTRTQTIDLGSNDPVLALDGGLDVVFGRIGARTSVGYARIFKNANADELRVSIGAVLRF